MDFPLRCLSTGVAVAGRLRIEGEALNTPKTYQSNYLYRSLSSFSLTLHPLFIHRTCFKILLPLGHALGMEGDFIGGINGFGLAGKRHPFPVSLPGFFDLRKVIYIRKA